MMNLQPPVLPVVAAPQFVTIVALLPHLAVQTMHPRPRLRRPRWLRHRRQHPPHLSVPNHLVRLRTLMFRKLKAKGPRVLLVLAKRKRGRTTRRARATRKNPSRREPA